MGVEVIDEVKAVGSAATFRRFYASSGDRVYRALRLTLGDGELASDAAQEAMARAWQRWDDVAGYDNPEGWVYRVGLNWARSRLRRWRREIRRRAVSNGQVAPVEPSDPALEVALGELSADHRAVVVLRFMWDWSLEETAAALEVPVGTVKSRQHWALKRLRERMEESP